MKKINFKKWSWVLLIIVIVIVVTFIFSLIYATNPFAEIWSVAKTVAGGTMVEKSAPEIKGIAHWLNTPDGAPLSLADLRGKVVLVDFWTYSCVNCQRDLPYVTAWDKKYRDYGLVIIGVHTPEFRFEQKLENVQAEVTKYDIEYPVALDNSYQTWRAFQNHYWPAKYLIDASGKIVYMRFGEGGYEEFEQKIQALLQEVMLQKVERLRE
jgi:thiol-disulfide isomerase/thioredoxin